MTAPFIPDDPHDWARRWAWPVIGELRHQIEPISALVLVALAQHGDADGRAYPSTHRLATLTGRSRKAVTRALLLLRDEHRLIAGQVEAKKATPWTFLIPAYLVTPRTSPDSGLATTKGSPDTAGIDETGSHRLRSGSNRVPNWLPPGRHTK